MADSAFSTKRKFIDVSKKAKKTAIATGNSAAPNSHISIDDNNINGNSAVPNPHISIDDALQV
jgi:hypothetical protein